MPRPADSFGSYGRAPLGAGLRAARAFGRAVDAAIVVALAGMLALAGYALWDDGRVLASADALVESRPEEPGALAELMVENPDVVGWLTVDNTSIDYPVVQGADNFEYLDKGPDGQPNPLGSVFLDAESDPSFHEPFEVVMAHHAVLGKMFGDLDRFLDRAFFDENQSASLMLPDRKLALEVVAVCRVDAYDADLYGTPFGSGDMERVARRVGETAVFEREGSYSATDQLIGLSTCYSTGTDIRTMLVCKVVGETAA